MQYAPQPQALLGCLEKLQYKCATEQLQQVELSRRPLRLSVHDVATMLFPKHVKPILFGGV